MTSKNRPIGLVPIGEVPEITSKAVAAHIVGYLKLDADILPPLEHPAYAYDEKRHQYDAGVILRRIASEPFQHYAKIVCILDVDIFVPIFSYVFGEAKQNGKVALVSLYRLKKNSDGSTPSVSLLLERAGKVALHELCHLYDLHHCMDRRCLMHFSGELEDLDQTPLYLCRYCTLYFRDALEKVTIHPS
jgi:archaemetzincin